MKQNRLGMGVALDNIAVGISIGIGIGLAIGLALGVRGGPDA